MKTTLLNRTSCRKSTKKQLKVLFSIDSLLGGGTETSTVELINLLGQEMECTVVYHYNKHDLKHVYEHAPCKLIYHDLPGNYSFFKGIQHLISLIRKEKYDLIVTSLYRSGIMCRVAGLMTGTPVIDTMVNDSYGAAKRNEFKDLHRIKFYFVLLLDCLTAKIPVLWISNSNSIAKSISSALNISSKKIRVIYRGRNVDEYKEWKIPEKKKGFHFVAIGRLFSQKGFLCLLKAFRLLLNDYPGSYLTIYGEGPQRKELELFIQKNRLQGNVILFGREPKAWKRLYEANCFVLPSLYEGFSGALVEAMLVGLPIIASDIPMNEEAIEHGKTGLLHKTNDSIDLLKNMKWVVAHYGSAIELGHSGRKVALEKYDIRQIGAQYKSVLESYASN
jgi:glycosyltransferase involved in cell wall biosynthesis